MHAVRHHLTACAAALLLALSLASCGGSTTPTEAVDGGGERATTEALPDVETTEGEPEETGAEADGDTQRIGDPKVGFVSVPSDWVKFVDVAGGSDLQWSDAAGTTIVTLNTFDMDSVPEDMRADFGAYEAASSVWDNIEADGGQDINGASVSLANKNAYQVYATYPDGTYLVTWCLEDDDGTIHYVAAEGPADTIYDLVDAIQDTYALSE